MSTCDLTRHSCVPSGVNPLAITLETMTPGVWSFDGGVEFILTGTNFHDGAIVTIDGVTVTNARVVSSTEIHGTLPGKTGKACGLTPLTVKNPDSDLPPASSSSLFHYRLLTMELTAVATQPSSVDSSASDMVTALLDGDGFYDLATVNESASSFTIFKGTGDLNFLQMGSIKTAKPFKYIQAAELAGTTPNPDIIVSSIDTINMYANNGLTAWDPIPGNIAVSNGAVAIADFNGDSKNDIISSIQDPPRIIFTVGQPSYPVQQVENLDGAGGPILAADWNGDGKQDLAFAAQQNRAIFVYLGDGSGNFGPAHLDTALGQPPLAMAAADMDGDGKKDLVVVGGQNSEGALTVLYGNGDGTFRPNPPVLALAGTLSSAVMSLADLDCDGLPEIVLSTNGDGNFKVVSPPEGNSFPQAAPPSFVADGAVKAIVSAPYDSNTLVDLGVLTSPGRIRIFNNTSH